MVRRRRTTAAPVFAAAAATYAANCTLGAAVAADLVDTSGFRWLHHALYVATCAAVMAALSAVRWGTPQRTSRSAALLLVPAAIPLAAIPFVGTRTRRHPLVGIPLAAIPFVGTRTRRHPLVALAAAPFIAASLIASCRTADRK